MRRRRKREPPRETAGAVNPLERTKGKSALLSQGINPLSFFVKGGKKSFSREKKDSAPHISQQTKGENFYMRKKEGKKERHFVFQKKRGLEKSAQTREKSESEK